MSSDLETALLAANAIIQSRHHVLTEAELLSHSMLILPVVEGLPGYKQALMDEKLANQLAVTDELWDEEAELEDLHAKVKELGQRLLEERAHYSELARERNSLHGEREYYKKRADSFEQDARRNYLAAKFFEAEKKGYDDYFARVPRGMCPYPDKVGEEVTASFHWKLGWDRARELSDLRKKVEEQELAYKSLLEAYGQAKQAIPTV